MPSKHALLSPSASHRWLHCTAAPLLEAKMPDTSSTFAEEGTLAHAIGARKIKRYLGQDTADEDREIAELSDKYHTGEMEEYTDTYAATVIESYIRARKETPDAVLLVERRLDFGAYIPDSFGTSDALIIADGVMEVIDLKYGKGVEVSAVGNPQMRIYALGAYDAFSDMYDIRRIRMTIIQPRVDNWSTDEMEAADLLSWADSVLKPKAAEALMGGEQNAGDWCRFCKVRATCRERARRCTAVHDGAGDPKLMTPAEIARDILPRLGEISAWVTAVTEYAQEQALAGVTFPGYKLVEGRSIRRVTDVDAVCGILDKAGYSAEQYLKPRALAGMTDLEKLVGKKQFAAMCGAYIEKPQGKPTLVPESDKRPPFNSAALDFADMQ